jgi:hypothetical protein
MKPETEFSNAAKRLHTSPAAEIDQEVAELVGDWLGCLAMLAPSERNGDQCGWCDSNHALDIARAVNGGRR